MADSFIVSKLEIASRITDAKTDRPIISGTATIRVEYGDTVLTFDVPFHAEPSSNAAEASVLKYAGCLAHFMESQAGEQERQARALR